ncbi:MAG TPA: hypothetical protein VM307_15330 [Egibacteraceae bacterium]|nr:hypothetical protein [Egibacteraceae bacterium]
MTKGNHDTHAALAVQLTASLERLRTDIESRTDPMLEEVANAIELVLRLTTHAHDHALENSRRLDALEQGRD